MKIKDKTEQQLSLNGSFGMLAYLLQEIDSQNITTIDELRKVLLAGMQDIHEEITKLENDLIQ